MTRTIVYDEGHFKFLFILVLLGVISVLSWIHWRTAMPVLVTSFSLTLLTYGYYATIWIVPSILLFFLGTSFLVQIARKKKMTKLGKAGKLSTKSAIKEAVHFPIKKQAVKADLKKVKTRTKVSPHRVRLLLIILVIIAAVGVGHYYMLINYLWEQNSRLMTIFIYEFSLFLIAYGAGFLLGLIAYIPFKNKPMKRYTV